MNKTEILMSYHGEVNKAVDGKSGIILRGQAISPIWNKYLTQLKAMVKAGTMDKTEYHWLTDNMITLNDTIRNS